MCLAATPIWCKRSISREFQLRRLPGQRFLRPIRVFLQGGEELDVQPRFVSPLRQSAGELDEIVRPRERARHRVYAAFAER